MTIDEDVLDRLEAEAKVSDAEPEELTLAVQSDLDEKDERVEQLHEEVAEKESEVEELEDEISEKESEIEELQDEVEVVVEDYAEELAEHSPAQDTDDFKQNYGVSKLREMHEELQDELEDESEPNPGSADPGPNVQSPEDGGDEGGEPEELSDMEQKAASAFEDRGGVYAEFAEEIKGE